MAAGRPDELSPLVEAEWITDLQAWPLRSWQADRLLQGRRAQGAKFWCALDSVPSPGDHLPGTEQEHAPLDRSFRTQLVFSIGFAVTRSRALLRRILTEHAPDDARQMLAERVVEHLEQSGFEIDEGHQVLKKRPPSANHG